MPDRPGLRPRHVVPRPLAELLAEAGAVAAGADPRGPQRSDQPLVTGITHDSRQVRPGDLYMALPGAVTHGARFVAAAIGLGAVAVVTDRAGSELCGRGLVPTVVVDDPRALMGELAAAVYGHPARDLLMLGVTGTNGKTTTAYMLDAGLRAAERRTGLIGTVGTRIGADQLDTVRTTPEATDVHALLAVMRERDVSACAMEVSSHAMAFGRVDGIVFDVAGFTNLSRDHLDFHADLDDYFAAKAALFTPDRARQAVVMADDEYGRRLARRALIPTTAVSTGPGHARSASHWHIGRDGDARTLIGTDGSKLELEVPIPGEFNVANAALAVAMLIAAGVPARTAVAGVGACSGVPGRMERVRGDDPRAPMALVDFAHTPDAVDNVLRAVTTRGRLIAVIGAGGDRDRNKRPLMGEAAARAADVVIVTDDNPRSEDAGAIRAEVLAGARAAPGGAEVVEVAGRREAIRAALRTAGGSGDTVVVLGKGHEQGQEIAGVVHPFDDRAVLREELRQWSEENSR